MNGPRGRRARTRTVLVLHGERAYWSRHAGDEVIARHDEALPASGAAARPSTCEWVRDRERDGADLDEAVTLLIDSPLEDIERLASAGFGRGPAGRWQRVLFARSLRRGTAFVDAEMDPGADSPTGSPADSSADPPADPPEILWLGRHGNPGTRASLLRDAMPPAWRAWLELLLDSGIVFDAISTATRELAYAVRDERGPVLFVAQGAALERHVLVVDGVPCFTRTVAVTSEARANALAETLEHLAEHWAPDALESIVIGDEAMPLSADTEAVLPGASPRRLAEPFPAALARFAATRSGWRRHRRGGGSHGVPRHWRPLVEPARRRRALRGLGLVTLANCIVGLIVLAHALAAGLGHARDREAAGRERGALTIERERAHAAALALHSDPALAAAALARADLLDRTAPPGARTVLSLIGGLLEDAPRLVVDGIAWSARRPSPEYAPPLAEIVLSDAAASPPRTRWPDATGRSASDPAVAAGLVVEIAGRVTDGTGVGDVQDVVDALLERLNDAAGVSETLLLDSPLEQAAAANDAAGGEGDDAPWRWRLRFAMPPRGADS